MKFDLESGQRRSVLTRKDENINFEIVAGLRSQIIDPANSFDSSNLITDSERVLFADSIGRSDLLMTQWPFCDSVRMMLLSYLTERIRKLVEISGLYHIIHTAGNRETALEYWSGTPNNLTGAIL